MTQRRRRVKKEIEVIKRLASKYGKILMRKHLLYDEGFISKVEEAAEEMGMAFEFYVKIVMQNHGREAFDLSILASAVGRNICRRARYMADKMREVPSSDLTDDLRLFNRKVRAHDGDVIQAFIEAAPLMSKQGREVVLQRLDPSSRAVLEDYVRALMKLSKRE